jgi:hypothetical protein
MDFFKKLTGWLTPSTDPGGEMAYRFNVKCARCGEVIPGRVDLRNDLTPELGSNDLPTGYYARKVLMGSGHCFQKVEVELTFDKNRKLTGKEVTGGAMIDPSKS